METEKAYSPARGACSGGAFVIKSAAMGPIADCAMVRDADGCLQKEEQRPKKGLEAILALGLGIGDGRC